jgi:hypothetical protein
VQPVDVDVVRLQATQRSFCLLHQCLSAGPATVGVALEQATEEFRADDYTVAACVRLRKEIANDLFGMAIGVDVGRVDEVAPAIQILGNHRLGIFRARAPAEVLAESHGPKAERADPKTGASDCNV